MSEGVPENKEKEPTPLKVDDHVQFVEMFRKGDRTGTYIVSSVRFDTILGQTLYRVKSTDPNVKVETEVARLFLEKVDPGKLN